MLAPCTFTCTYKSTSFLSVLDIGQFNFTENVIKLEKKNFQKEKLMLKYLHFAIHEELSKYLHDSQFQLLDTEEKEQNLH